MAEEDGVPDYFLGVDAGGSNCRARLVDAGGAIVGTGRAGPANAGLGLENLRAVLLDAALQATGAAGLGEADLSRVAAGFGIAGLSRPGVAEAVEAMAFPFASVAIDSDAAIASLGALSGRDGAILVLGTGSIAHLRLGDASFSIGGYGFPISDEGSGAALGLSALRHALRALDGRSRGSPLSGAITARFGHQTPRIIAWMSSATPSDYGSFAPLVMEHAEGGDEIARSIVEDAALHVERFIETIFLRGAPRCVLVGGLAPRLRPWLRYRTVERLSEADGDALDGALLLAGMPRG